MVTQIPARRQLRRVCENIGTADALILLAEDEIRCRFPDHPEYRKMLNSFARKTRAAKKRGPLPWVVTGLTCSVVSILVALTLAEETLSVWDSEPSFGCMGHDQ